MLRNSKKGVMTGVYAALVVLLILTLVFAVNFGSVDIYYKDVFQIVYGKIFNKDLSAYKSSQINIIWALRLPKVIVAACTGAGLVLTGILMQAITKNPLADPYVLGISSGASAGAVVSLLIGTLPVIGRVPLAESSFAGAASDGGNCVCVRIEKRKDQHDKNDSGRNGTVLILFCADEYHHFPDAGFKAGTDGDILAERILCRNRLGRCAAWQSVCLWWGLF